MSLCVFKDTFVLIGDRNAHRKTGTHTRTNALPHSFSVALSLWTGMGTGTGGTGTGTGEQGTQDAGRRQTGSKIDAGRQVLQENAKKSGEGRQNAPPPFALLSRFR
jgi:hypothetical protein